MALPTASILPPALFSPFDNVASLVAYPNQQVQYFAQGQSNPPGQTSDLIIRTINSIIALISIAQQTYDYPTSEYGPAASDLLEKTTVILSRTIDGIIDKFANHPNWFSAILPNKGYASMSSANSFYGQPNIGPLFANYQEKYKSALSVQNVVQLIYAKLYALTSDLVNKDTQINRYTYKFISTAIVTSPDYSGGTQTHSVESWFSTIILPQWVSVITTATQVTGGSYWLTSPSYFWKDYIEFLLDGTVTTNAVVIEQLIPSFYTAAPANGGAAPTTDSDGTSFWVYMFTLFAILLGKQLKSLSLSASKIASLREGADLPFAQVSQNIAAAEHVYLLNFNGFIKTVNEYDTSTGTSSFLTFPTINSINTIATIDSRNASADPNRSPGSFQPTILFQIVLIDLLQKISGVPLFQTYVSGRVSSLQTSYGFFIASLPTVKTYLNDAFNDLIPREDIHFGQWPQNMSNI